MLKEIGIPFEEVIERLIELGWENEKYNFKKRRYWKRRISPY